jgi:hypothetical protein
MVNYECELCEFSTKRKTELDRHILTKKHINNINDNDNNVYKKNIFSKNVEKLAGINDTKLAGKNIKLAGKNIKSEEIKFMCEKCGSFFNHKSSLSRHKIHRCEKNNKEMLELQQKNDKLELQNEKLLKIASDNAKIASENAEAVNKNAEAANKNAETLNIATKNNKKTVSMMSYAVTNLQSAPTIKQLKSDNIVKLLRGHNKSKISTIEDVLLHQYENNILHQYVGEVIIEYYKKDNKKKQSVWSTDVSRNNFIIKCVVVKGNNSEWINDKSGEKMKKFIIIPIIDKIKSMMNDYTKKIGEKMMLNNVDDMDEARDLFITVMNCNKLIGSILKKKLHLKILKFISPKFDLNVDDKIFSSEDESGSDSDSESESECCFNS